MIFYARTKSFIPVVALVMPWDEINRVIWAQEGNCEREKKVDGGNSVAKVLLLHRRGMKSIREEN